MDKEYWSKRFEYLEKLQIVNEEKYIEQLTEQYTVALEKIKKEINNWFTRFAVNNQISLRESKKWLNTSELKELQWDIKEYIRHGEENGIDLIWKKELENASAKVHISRLNALMLQIQERLEELYAQQNNSLSEYIIDTYKDTYYNSAYALQSGFNVAFNISAIDESIITKLILNPWTADGMTFSDRIWKNKKELINTLQTELTQAIIRGDGLESVINKIAKKFNTEKNKAGRLVMTETAFFSSQARKQCFNDLWVKKYEIVATLDSHTSQICRGLDGKVFNMKDYSVGITAPPFHVWCRSTTAPYFNDKFEFGERAARNTDGKTYYIASNIKYNDWYNEYVQNPQYLKDKSNKKEVNESINNTIKDLPKNIQKLIENTTFKMSFNGSQYDRKNDTIELLIDSDKYEILHEIGHAIETKLDIFNDNKFIDILKNNISEMDIIRIKRDKTTFGQEIDLIENDKFISEYQGRVYNYDINKKPRFDNITKRFNYKTLGEYFSEGFATYFTNKEILKEKDIKLYRYIEELCDG